MKIGDVVTIKIDASLRYLDYQEGMRGNQYIVTYIEDDTYVRVDFDGGWFINVAAIESINSKTKIEHKIAIMYKRFANRKGN